MDQLKKRKREQEKQKRERLVQSKSDSFPSKVDSPIPPRFPSLKRTDGQSDELTRMTKNILGPYDACQVAMQSMNQNQQQQLLGTFEATPSTPLHAATGNPFERQFGKSLTASGLSTTGFSTKGVTSAASYSSAAQSRAELNRHSVAGAPNSAVTRGDEKAGSKPRTHGHTDHGPTLKFGKQPSDSTSRPTHKKEQSDVGSRPSNTLPVRKREKGRVRPFKSTGPPSPTGNQQGLTQTKKPAGTGAGLSQGMGDLFKVDSEQGSGGNTRPTTPTISETATSRGRTSTPPVSSSTKRPQKLKKRHSHHTSLPVAASGSTAEFPTTLPSAAAAPQAMRKSSSIHSNSSAPLVSLSSSSTTSTPHHKHKKQSSSTASTTLHSSSSSSHPPRPATPTKRKQGSATSLLSSHAPQNPPSNPIDRRVASATSVKPEPLTLERQSMPTVSSPPHSSSSSLPLSQSSCDVSAVSGHSEVKLARKKKRAKRERERALLGHRDASERDKSRTEVKLESSDIASKSVQDPKTYVAPLNPHQTISLSNPPLTSQDQMTAGRARSKVKLEKPNKPRPSNLTIETYGENTEESPMDIRDVQTLLKELMTNVSVPSPVTPLPTPRHATPFMFPQTSSTTSETKLESIAEAPPIGPAYLLSDSESNSSGSSSSGSSSDSSDSDEDNEQGHEGRREGTLGVSISSSVSMEESETSTPGWEKVLPSISDSLTPLKTPPTVTSLSSFIPPIFNMPTTVISPLAPETPPSHSHQIIATTHHGSSFSPSMASTVHTSTDFSSIGGGFVLGTNVIINSHDPLITSIANASISNSSSILPSDAKINSQASIDSGDPSNPRWVNPEVSLLPCNAASSAPQRDPMSMAADDASSSSSESDEEEDESGSESDDEMSADSSSEEEREEEMEDKSSHLKSEETSVPRASTAGGSVSSAPFFGGDDSFSFQGVSCGGFFNDEDFISQIQGNIGSAQTGGEGSASYDPMGDAKWFHQQTGGDTRADSKSDGLPQMPVSPSQKTVSIDRVLPIAENLHENPATSFTSETQPQCEVAVTETDSHPPATLSHQLSLDTGIRLASGGKKRKLERQTSLDADPSSMKFQPSARKTPRTSYSAALRRRDSSISSFSVSSESSCSSSDSSDDEQSDTEQSLPPSTAKTHLSNTALSLSSTLTSDPSLQSVPPSSFLSATNPSSTGLPLHTPLLQTAALPSSSSLIDPLPPRQPQQLEAGELEDEEMEEGRWEREAAVVGRGQLENLWVKIPLEKVEFQREKKPKAKVEPYNVTAPSKPPRRRSTIDSSSHEDLSRLPGSHHADHDVRSMYGRQRDDDHHGQYGQADFHREDGRRSHRGSVWDSGRERESWGTGRHGVRGNRPHDRDRERDHHRNRNWDDYSSYDDARSRSRGHPSNRNMSAEDFLREARKRKHEADRTRTPGIDKAKAYLESVVYFMRHGEAIEREAQSWDGSQTRNPFRLYMDTITLVKYCRSWASDCKQLVALCMRCVSVLYWKLFLLKQTTAGNIQKDLHDFFVPSKGTQKSPYVSSLSPIPSPASVGSTTSTGSGVGGASSLGSSQDPSPSSTVTVPKLIFNKAAEHLTITGYLHQSMELWQQSNLIVEQYRDFFSNLERRSGRITQFSPIAALADWLETGARSVRYHS